MRKIYLVLFILLGFINKGISQTLSPGTLADFGSVCVGSTAGPNSFTLSGSSLTNENITIGPLSGYTFSTTSGGIYSSTLTITQTGGTYSGNVFVKFTPASATSYNGNIPITGGGATATSVAVTGSGQANQTPSVSIVSDDADNNICSGTSVTFTATPTNGGVTPSYQWYVNGSVAGSNSPTFTTSSLTNSQQVKVIMTSNAACATPSAATSNVITMTVNSTVAPSVTISTPSTSVCSRASSTFTAATPTNGGTSPTYQWQISTNGGGSFSDISAATSNTYTTSTLAQGDIIRLQLTSSALCASPNPVTSNELTITIKPDATINLTSASGTDNQSKCINTAITAIKYTIAGGGTGATVSGLPAGVSSSFAGGILTISGTPSESGPFNYTVSTTGTCAQTTANGTITVNPDASLTLTTANNNQTLCENIAIAAIRFTIGGTGNNASVTGLPAGVTDLYSGGVLTISGKPTVSGTFAYTVTATGTCGNATATGTLTVNPDATINLTSASGTDNQAKCINTALTAIKYTIGGGATGATVTGLPSGVSYSLAGSVLTISGTPTQSGTFNYTVTTTGTCAQTTAPGQIVVNPDASITLSTGNNNQTKCVNTAIANISFNIGGTGNNASATGLPAGVSGVYSSGVFTISGNPTVAGSFPYTVTAIGSCGNATSTGTLTVNPAASISLSSASGTDNQNLCVSTLLTPIKYNVGGGGTNAGVTGLPAGVTGAYIGGVFTISGTPTATGTFNYTVTTSGTCAQTTATGQIVVNPDASITLTSGNNNQTKCINTSIANITYTISGGGTGATVTGLPSGVTGLYSGGNFTISGTPGTAGTFNYTVTTSGTCSQKTATGTIIVNPDATISLTSAASTTSQNVCAGSAISNIKYSVTGASTITSTGLPSGVNAVLSGGVVTISGSPSVAGTFNYTITTTGPCINVSATGSITVWSGNPDNWSGNPITISPSPSVCPPATMQFSVPAVNNVRYYKWTLPAGFSITSGDSTNAITVSVTSSATVGNNQTVSVQAFNSCGNNNSKSDKVNVNNFTGVTVSPTTQSVCAGGSITVVGTLTGNAASGTWSAPSGTFSNIVTSSTSPITVTATYTPSISSGNVTLTITTNAPTGSGCSNVPGTAQVKVTVNQPSVAPTSESASTTTICNGGSTTLTQSGGTLGTGAVWKWYSNSSYTTLVGTSSAADGSLTLSPTATTTYYVRAESTTGAPCANPVAGAGSVTVTVNQPSVAPTSESVSTTTICNGSSITLTQNGGSLGTGAVWKWYSNSTYTTLVGTSSAADGSLTLSPTATTTYYVRAESTTGAPCANPVAGAGSVTVTVNQPSVAPTSESVSTTTICNGSSITLTQNGGSLGTGAVWKWYSNSTYTTLVGTSSTADGSLTLSPTATTTYYVRAESTTGAPCANPVAGAGSVTVTVNQPSVAPASLAASTATICSGSATTLTQTGGSVGTGAGWKWYSDASYTQLVGSGSGSNASLSVSPTTTTTYYLQIEGGMAPCSATLQGPSAGVTVTVNQPSVAPTSENASTTTICNGGSTTLTQNGGTLGTGAVWKWYSNSTYTTLVGTSSAADGSLTLSPTATTTYYLRAESTTGAPCSPAVAGAGSVTVTVNQPSIAPVSLAASTATICSGSSAVLTQTGGSLGTGASWKWYSDAGYTQVVASGSGANASLTVNPTTTTTYYLQIEGGTAPCSGTLQGPAAGVTVTVNQPSVAPTSESASTSTICNGSSTTLTQNGGSLGTGAIWKWYSNSTYTTLVGTSSAADGSLTLSPTATITYYVRAESTTGAPCTANVTGAGSVIVTVNQPVVINTQPQNFGTCASTPAQFGVVASGDGLTYQWYKGNIGSGVAVTNSSNITGATSNILKFAQVDLSDAAPYYVIVSGASPCSSVTSNQVTLNVDKSITFNTQPQSQTVCVNAASVTFTVAADANGDVLNYQWRKNGTAIGGANSTTFTINNVSLGDAGDYDVLVTGPSGYTCSNAYSGKATLSVNDNSTLTLSSAAGTDGQTVCINNKLTNIKYTIGGGGTGASITSGSLPDGVTGIYSAGVFTISGTPTKAGIFTYTITTDGPCNNLTANGTITVNDNSTISLSSAAGTDGQTICINTALTNISYNIGGGGTGASITTGALPAGVTGSYNSGVFTISGTPTVSGNFNYTVTTTGPCNNVSASGTITVSANSTITLSSPAGTDAQTKCINTAISNITYAIGGGGTGASITAGALPAGVTGSYNAGVFTISGTPTVSGNFSYTITTVGPCSNLTASGTISVSPVSVGGTLSPKLQTGCQNATGNITLGGNTGSVAKWQLSTNGGTSWTDISNTTNAYSYGPLMQTTSYRAVIQSGACSVAYSDTAVVSVVPPMKPNPVTPTPRTICAGGTSVLTSGTGYPTIGIADSSGFFNTASNSSGWGWNKCYLSSCVNAGGDNGNPTPWLETTSEKVNPPLITYFSSDNKFAVVRGSGSDWGNGDTSVLETPAFSLIGQTSSVFQFSQGYVLTTTGASISIEISTDGGSTYSAILSQVKGVATSPGLSGYTITLQPTSISLANYIGLSNLKIRFKYTGAAGSSWALDNIQLPATLPITYQWSDTTKSGTTILTPPSQIPQTPITVAPTVTTTYTITTYVGGCYAGSDTVTVFVNPVPTIALGNNPSVCQGTTVASVPYTATTQSPTTYSIVFDAAAHTAGLRDSTNVTFPGTSPINFTVPAGIAAGTYNGTISVTNANKCGSTGQPFTITIKQAPTGTVTGGAFCPSGSTTLAVTNQTGGTPQNATWSSTPSGLTIDASSGLINLASSTSGTYTVAYNFTGSNGCATYPVPSTTVTVNPQATVQNQPADQLLCPETASVMFTVSATGSPSYNWSLSSDQGTTWTPVSSSDPDYSGQGTSTLTVKNIMSGNTKDGYQYKTDLAINNLCPVPSTSAKLTIHNIWHGYTNTDWYTTSNWSDGALPTLTCDSVIILNVSKLPVVSGGGPGGTGAYTNHLVIRPNATVKVVNDTLHIGAGIWDNNMALDATQGTIDLNGNVDYVHGGTRPAQTIAGKMFNTPYNNNSGRIMNLQISNPKGVTVSARSQNDTLNILHTLSFGNVNSVTLTTNDNITLISDANGTARLADLTNYSKNSGNNLSGDVEVERFIRTGEHGKAWEFIAIANKGQSIFDSWMEGGSKASTGYGTQISGSGAGLDMYSSQPSMKYLGPSGELIDWTGVSSKDDQIYNPEGYMVFVRGDRSVDPYINPTANPTRLRTKGTLLTYDKTITLAGITGFASVGNPYAAPIDMRKVMPLRTTATVGNSYYTWKSPAPGTYGYGSYVIYTQNDNGDYEPTPFGATDVVNNNIESGQAFILQTVGGPASISFKETVKVDAYSYNNTVFRSTSAKGTWQKLRANIYSVTSNGKATIVDGVLIHFADNFSNKVDVYDSRKIFNPGPSLSIKEDGANLIVESREMPSSSDTIHLQLTNATPQNYRLVFVARNLSSSGLQAYMEDHFMNTITPLQMEDTTVYDFAITNSTASNAADRFDIVFRKTIVLPPSITSFAATAKGRDVITGWNVIHEMNVAEYEVERSLDGTNYVKETTVAAGNSGAASYNWTDSNILPGYYYYRIKMIDQKGKIQYSQPVKVLIGNGKPSISVYPNPVMNGVIHLQFLNEPAGRYAIRLMNQIGQVIVSKQIERMNGSDSQSVQWDYNLAHGVYQMEITRPDGSVKIIKVIY